MTTFEGEGALPERLRDPDPTRATAGVDGARGCGRAGGRRAADRRPSADPDATVRRLAIGLLEELGDGRAAPALICRAPGRRPRACARRPPGRLRALHDETSLETLLGGLESSAARGPAGGDRGAPRAEGRAGGRASQRRPARSGARGPTGRGRRARASSALGHGPGVERLPAGRGRRGATARARRSGFLPGQAPAPRCCPS